MKSLPCLIGVLSLSLVSCASAPKAIKVENVNSSMKKGLVTYMLPKSAYAVSATWEKRTYVPGVLTPDLKAWLLTRDKFCTKADAFDSESLCAWGLGEVMTPAASTVLQCEGDKDTVISLVRTADPVLTTTTSWDTSQHYAIELARRPFQSSELQVDYSPIGTLGGYTAKSTNLIADAAEKVATELAGDVFLDPPTGATNVANKQLCNGSPALCAWAQKLAALQKKRLEVLMGQDPKGASALIDEQIKALRALAEGVERTGPFSIKITLDPPSKNYSANTPLTAYAAPAEDDALATKLRCSKNLANAVLTFRLDPNPAEVKAIESVAERSVVSSPALFYRLPLPAIPSITINCSGAGVPDAARCTVASGGFKSDFPTILVPQWGPTLSLPRTLGWRSGALTAKLDPLTGALTSLSASSQGALEASVLNGLYTADTVRRAAEQAAAAKDTERATMERERILLEEQVKICAARRTLGQPLGDECPK